MLLQAQSYRDFLKETLAQKAHGKDGYTLGAFAKKIGISTSYLSEVLASKKSFSMEQAFKIAVRLKFTDLETQYFCILVQLDNEKDPDFREELLARLKAINPEQTRFDLSLDLFRVIADWYHFALLELTFLPDFKLTGDYVASRLGITKVEAETAIDRLKRMEMLERKSDGKWGKTHSYMIAQSSIPNEALKTFHKQLLQKAVESIDEQTPRERVSATDVLPIDSNYLSQVDRLSREFSAAVLKLSQRSKVKDSVYSLSVHFHKLTQSEENS